MDTSYFEEFIILAEMQKYADAAEYLSISEPSLSRHIKALENELGVTLFDRTSRRVSLNIYGQIFLPYARQFLSLQQAYTQELLEAQTHQKNTVVVGTLYQINDLLSQFYNYDPSIFIVSTGLGDTPETMAEKMRSGKCEVAFLPDPYTYENEFTLLPFARDKFVAVLPSDHPMAGRDSLHVRELKNENFVSFMEGAYGDCAIKNLCNRAGFTPRVSFNADSAQSIISFVSEGMGVSLVFENSISPIVTESVAVVPLIPEESVDICLCFRRDVPLSDAANKFVTYVQEHYFTEREQ